MKKYIAVALLAAGALSMQAQETMYLVKGNHIIGTYPAEEVDYITFNRPTDVDDSPIWITSDNVGKNEITFTVHTASAQTAYAYAAISYYDANYYAMDYYDSSFNELPDGTKKVVLSSLLYGGAYIDQGTKTVRFKDFMPDGTTTGGIPNRMSVKPGCEYFITVLQVDASTQEPMEFTDYIKVKTLDPGTSDMQLSATFLKAGNETLDFEVKGNDKCQYVMTAYGMKELMNSFIEMYGYEYVMYTFGQTFTLDELAENASWPAYDTGDYVLYVEGFDADGNVLKLDPVVAHYEAPAGDGPKITVFSKEATSNSVSVNFEISPSNVSEAYVRLLTENECDDLRNDGWELYEIASTSRATDITSDINRLGEYTFTDKTLEADTWYTLLIYAKGEKGERTVGRLNFATFEGAQWDINLDAAKAPRRHIKVLGKNRPVLPRR